MAKKHGWSTHEAPVLARSIHEFDFQGGSVLGFSMKEMGNKGLGTKEVLGSNLLEDYLADDDFFNEQTLPKKQRRLNPEQVSLLEKSFEEENKLLPERKSELARTLGLNPRQIAIWFQNRKARWKTKQLERDYDQLKASYDKLLADHDSLRANHDSILNDNQQLRHKVAFLTEKLQAKEIHSQWAPITTTEATMTTALEPTNKARRVDQLMEADDASCANKLEDRLSNRLSHVTNVAGDGELRFALEDERNNYQGGHSHVIISEEEGAWGGNGSVINGGYFSDVYTNDGADAAEHQPSPHDEAEGGLGWWIWHY